MTPTEHWSTRLLSQCGRLLSGGTPSKSNPAYWEGSLPWFSSKEVKCFELSETELGVTDAGAENGTNLVPPGTVLFVVRGMSLANEFRVGVTMVPSTFNQDVKAVVPAPDVDPRYLARCLRWLEPLVLSKTEESSHGTKRLPGHVFEQLLIPLPPLSEQRRIADILDKADAVRRKRREAIALTEELLRSAFLEMFGDPVTNPRGWEETSIGECAERVTKGESPGWQGFEYQERGVRFVTSENVLFGQLDLAKSKTKFIPTAFDEKLARSRLRENDVLVNLVGASIGRAAIATSEALPANINQAVAVISLDTQHLLPVFLLQQLLTASMQRRLLGNIVDAARANISLTNIRDLRVIRPPSEEQIRWQRASFAGDCLRHRYQEAGHKAEELFSSLVQRAFRGELARGIGSKATQLEMFTEAG
jgi:type I restriction enzyme, S subunit